MQTVSDLEWEHARLLADLVERCEAVASDSDSERIHALVDFLQGPFAVHARGEEDHFYPAIASLLRLHHGHPTDTMRYEHRAFAGVVDRLAGLADAYDDADESQRAGLRSVLSRAAIQLEAVARMHMEAEEHAFLPLLVHLGAEERAALLERMHIHQTSAAAGREV